MSHEEAQPLDDQFADLLAAHEDALLHGAPAAASPPPELKSRLDEALQCVQMLQRMWPAPGPDENEDAGGTTRGRYQLSDLHAIGGVGRVWLAYDAGLNREVALKELQPDRAGDPAFARRFLHEARITGRLQHPGIVPVYELVPGAEGKSPFYTMRFVRGRTLADAVDKFHARPAGSTGPLELNALLTPFVNICNTVAYAHSQGIVHRDLKTANVVLGDFGEVVLLDWGFAKELGGPEEPLPGSVPADAPPGQTVAGQIVGTPGYMAPEQAAAQPDRVGTHTDVFGLGAILYEILTGRPPFVGADALELIRRARDASPPPPEEVCPAAPPPLAAVCRRAMAREPGERYASAGELAREVQRWLADEPTIAYRESAPERIQRWGRRHQPLVAGAAALIVTAFTAGMIGLVLLEKEQARTAGVRAQAAAEKAAADAAAREELEGHLYVERLALAERELAAHNLARVTQLLSECPPERRGWEWACLERLCHADLLVLRGHPAPVSGAVFCLGGKRIASASHDHSLKLWDAETGRELQTLAGHTDLIHYLNVSADGRLLASGSWDRTVRIWDAETGRLLQTMTDHPAIVTRVAFANAKQVASVSGEWVKLWDIETGRELRSYHRADRVGVYGLAISPDGRLLASGEADGLLRIRDLNTAAEVHVLRGHRSPPKHLAFSPDGRLLAAGDGPTLENEPGVVKLWDVRTGREVASLEGHTYPVFAVAFSPNGRRLFSGSQDNSIKVWDVERARLVLTLRGHADVVRSLAFSPDGNRLASASADRTVRIWDASPWTRDQSPGEMQTLRGHTEPVLGVAFTADGRRLLAINYDGDLKTWDAESGQLLGSNSFEPKNRQRFHALAVGPGELLALGSGSGAVFLLAPESGKVLGVCSGYGAGPVQGVAFRRDGKQIAAAEWRSTVRLWDTQTRRPAQTFSGHTEPVTAVAFSAGDQLLASGSFDQTVRVCEPQSGKPVWILQGHTSRVTAVAFPLEGDRHGDLLASASKDGIIKLWDMRTGREVRELRGHTAAVGAMRFSPDGRWLASASDDWTIKLWDAAKGEVVRTFRGHTGPVRSLAWDRTGRRLASGSQDHTARIWEVPP